MVLPCMEHRAKQKEFQFSATSRTAHRASARNKMRFNTKSAFVTIFCLRSAAFYNYNLFDSLESITTAPMVRRIFLT